MKPYEVSPGYMGLPRLFTTFSDDTPDVKRFAQVRSYQCSHVRANAHVGGPNLLTSEGIYQLGCWSRYVAESVPSTPIAPISLSAFTVQQRHQILRNATRLKKSGAGQKNGWPTTNKRAWCWRP